MSDEEKVIIEEEVVGPIRALGRNKGPEYDLILDVPNPQVRGLVFWPDPELTKVSALVETFDDELSQLVADMAMTMYATGGVGLAAPQVGVMRRVFIVDIFANQPPKRGQPASQLLVAVNPEVTPLENTPGGAKVRLEEGCLSFPSVRASIERPGRVHISARDRKGRPYVMAPGGTLARVIQHEMDHLDGVVFLDRMDELTRAAAIKGTRRFNKGVRTGNIRLAPRKAPAKKG